MNLYYIGEFDFNRNQAATVRILNNCKAIVQNFNYHIRIIGYSDIPETEIDSIKVLNVNRGKNVIFKLFFYLLRPFFILRLIQRSSYKPDIIIYYGTTSRILFPLLIYCKQKRIKLIVDIVEWQDYSHLPFGKFGPIALDMNIAITKLIPKCDGVIAISSYLENYYQQKGMKTLRVPVLVDIDERDCFSNNIFSFDQKYLNLIYAGYAGKKDLIINAIEAVNDINKEGVLVKLHLLGTTRREFQKTYTKDLSESILFYGKLPHSIVQTYLSQADFSVLLRPDKRYAHAGFPTKFVESMNMGLPVIANFTSDLNYYLHDGINGYVVNGYSPDALVDVLKRIIAEDTSHLKLMKINARQTALEYFDYGLYSGKFNQFINEVFKNI